MRLYSICLSASQPLGGRRLKMALLGLGLHQGFIVSYLNPKVPTKALLLMDGCQIIVAEGRYDGGPPIVMLLTPLPGP